MSKTYSYHYNALCRVNELTELTEISGILVTKTEVLCPRTLCLARDQIRENHGVRSSVIKNLNFLGEQIDKTGRAKFPY